MIKLGNIFAAALLLSGGAYIGHNPAMIGDAAHYARTQLRALTGYDLISCQADSVACLENRQYALEKSRTEIEKAIDDLGVEIAKVNKLAAEAESRYAKNNYFLQIGKETWKSAQFSGRPIQFVNMTYPDAASFRVQLESLLAENKTIEAEVTKVGTLKAQLEARLQQLRTEQGRVRATIAALPSQIKLIGATNSLAEIARSIKMIDDVIQTSDKQNDLARPLIGSTDELVRRNESTGIVLSPRQIQLSAELDKFLAQ